MNTRRTFLRLAAVAGSSTFFSPFAWAGRLGVKVFSPGTLDGYAQGLLSRASLERQVGTLFMAFLDDDRVAYMHLETVEIEEKPKKIGTGKGTAEAEARTAHPVTYYSATFVTGSDPIQQDTYVLDHSRLGRNAVFLVPGIDKTGRNTVIATFSAAA